MGHSVEQGDMFVNQLRHVFVAGRNQRGYLLLPSLLGEGANHIVGFYIGNNQ